MSLSERMECIAAVEGEIKRPPCPFKPQVKGKLQKCTKASGVCTFKAYERDEQGSVRPVEGPDGALRCLCPERFNEGSVVFDWIGREILKAEKPIVVAQVPFLSPEVAQEIDTTKEPKQASEVVSGRRQGSVGRIDHVLVHPNLDPFRWCAAEFQAVYFSGKALREDFPAFSDPAVTGIPFPQLVRRPDYRSSGPKRLMPQLEIKVPALSRWAKKVAVVIDEGFSEFLTRTKQVGDVSNCEIAWFIVGFEEDGDRVRLVARDVKFTILKDAVDGLTAGLPMKQEQFEDVIRSKLPS